MNTDSRIQELVKETEKVVDSHRQFHKVRFDDNSMDFAFQWVLGCIRNGGGEVGEIFQTASGIEDYNPDSWASEWPKMAEHIEQRAKDSEKNGHTLSASELYLRASCYYRAALTSMLPKNQEFMSVDKKYIECLSKAGGLSDYNFEMINVPFEKTVLPGCFIKAKNTDEKQKTILVIGGGETFFIDLYLHIAPSAVKRGYNFVTVDIPGQGVLPEEGCCFRPDSEKPIGAVIDYLLKRPEVDAEKLAVYGISLGGYFVPRAAIHDKRIKACISNCSITNFGKYMSEMAIRNKTADASGIKMSPFNIRMTQIVAWRFGLDINDLSGIIAKAQDYSYDASKINCPALNISSWGEYLNPTVKSMCDEFIMLAPNPKNKMVVTSFEDGANTHCLGENTGLMSVILFDWLDEIFC